MKISLIQMNSVSDKAANIAAAATLIERAVAEERPDWICLPECFDFLGGDRKAKMAAAETLPGGPAYAAMQKLAKKHHIYIHAGSILDKPKNGERIHNTTVVFDRAGGEIARYRKIHMFDVTAPDGTKYNESAVFAPGDAAVTYQCEDM
ncbi:MAG: nitrilase-related carbon-nitrogen hydrolase, partial [Methylocella sp.]